jgi:hypothetical protein
MRLEYITIYLLMKRIIIKMQNNINGHSHYLIAIGMPCVFILRNMLDKISYIFYILDFAHVIISCRPVVVYKD